MALPACLSPGWSITNPSWETERRFVEVIVHGTGPLAGVQGLRLWFGNTPEAVAVPLRKRIWLDVMAYRMIAGIGGVCITKLRECDELPQ